MVEGTTSIFTNCSLLSIDPSAAFILISAQSATIVVLVILLMIFALRRPY